MSSGRHAHPSMRSIPDPVSVSRTRERSIPSSTCARLQERCYVLAVVFTVKRELTRNTMRGPPHACIPRMGTSSRRTRWW
jgi:hypothetical protein